MRLTAELTAAAPLAVDRARVTSCGPRLRGALAASRVAVSARRRAIRKIQVVNSRSPPPNDVRPRATAIQTSEAMSPPWPGATTASQRSSRGCAQRHSDKKAPSSPRWAAARTSSNAPGPGQTLADLAIATEPSLQKRRSPHVAGVGRSRQGSSGLRGVAFGSRRRSETAGRTAAGVGAIAAPTPKVEGCR
jgi:hypothetical protein